MTSHATVVLKMVIENFYAMLTFVFTKKMSPVSNRLSGPEGQSRVRQLQREDDRQSGRDRLRCWVPDWKPFVRRRQLHEHWTVVGGGRVVSA